MAPEVVEGVKRLIDRRIDGLRELSISWFGGEPLLARDILEEISTHVLHAQSTRPAVSYRGDITTNGSLLTDTVVDKLVELGIRFIQVSLDGPEALHDSTRRRTTGRGSFRQIWKNLLSIRQGKLDLEVLLRIHLTPLNIHVMDDFLRELRDTFLSDSRFRVFLKPVERMGGPNNDTIDVIPHEDHRRVVASLKAALHLEGRDTGLFQGENICYAARANSLMIRADGRIGKCTVAMSDPANTIGQLLSNGLLRIDNSVLRPWLRGWQTGDRAVLACPYVAIAAGSAVR